MKLILTRRLLIKNISFSKEKKILVNSYSKLEGIPSQFDLFLNLNALCLERVADLLSKMFNTAKGYLSSKN